MKESDRTVPMLYERNDSYVIEAFRQGEFDYLEGVGEVSEADFFRAVTGKNILGKLADTYPSACKKHDVPVWVYIASDLSMRFHGGPSLSCLSLRGPFWRDGPGLWSRDGS
jgi:hypothetical protein